MSEQKAHAEIIAEQLTNIESLGDELPAVIAAGSLRKLLRHLDEAHKREIEDAERRGNHEATKAVCETIEKAGPFYDAESVGNAVKLREALEKCAKMGEQIDCQLGSSDETVYAFRDERCLAHNISECARAALAAPPRNCDFFHSGVPEKDAQAAWDAFEGNLKLEVKNLSEREYAMLKEFQNAFRWLFSHPKKG